MSTPNSEDTCVLIGPDGLRVELDKSQVFHDDPGQGTPALVVIRDARNRITASSTYGCACGEGYLDGGRDGDIQLTPAQMAWLSGLEDQIGDFLQW